MWENPFGYEAHHDGLRAVRMVRRSRDEVNEAASARVEAKLDAIFNAVKLPAPQLLPLPSRAETN